jgi:hypothetical protein
MQRAQSDSTFTPALRPTQCSDSVMVRPPEQVFGFPWWSGSAVGRSQLHAGRGGGSGTAVHDRTIEHEHKVSVWFRELALRAGAVRSEQLARSRRYFSMEVSPNGAPDGWQPAAGCHHLLITEFRNVNAGEAMPSSRPRLSGWRAHVRGFCHLIEYWSDGPPRVSEETGHD